MVQDGAGGGGSIAHISVAEVTDEHFVDVGDEHLKKGLVSLMVLVKDCGCDIMGVAKVGDLGGRRDRWDGRLGAGVKRSNETCG